MSVLVSTLQGHKNTIYMGIPYECPSVILAWSQVQKNRMFVHKWPLWPYAEAAVYSYEQHTLAVTALIARGPPHPRSIVLHAVRLSRSVGLGAWGAGFCGACLRDACLDSHRGCWVQAARRSETYLAPRGIATSENACPSPSLLSGE